MLDKMIILASNSPRREQLLKSQNIDFEIIPSDYEEQAFSLDPILTAKTFAQGKALDVYNKTKNKDAIILSADTVVFLDGQILGKPQDEQQAFSMLKSLSNKTHSVTTGFCIKYDDKEIIDSDTTLVTFNNLSYEQIDKYIKSGLYKGKAGAYGIQDHEFNLVKSYSGSLNNVIGLPIEKIIPLLKTIIK